MHQRERLKTLSKLDDKVYFVKEVINAKPKQLTKTKKKIDNMKLITDQIQTSLHNTSLLMLGETNFSPKQILNKKLIFDTTIIDEETIMDKIIEALDDLSLENDKYWIPHEPGSNFFMLRLEDGR